MKWRARPESLNPRYFEIKALSAAGNAFDRGRVYEGWKSTYEAWL